MLGDIRIQYMLKPAVFLALVLSGCACAFQAPTVEQDVVYRSVNGADLHLDVYRPSSAEKDQHPAVILIHGGGWNSLNKSTMRPMGQFLAGAGFVCFAVDYRLFDGKQNRWPAQLDDVQHAVEWIRTHAKEYDVRPERIGAYGHSAGAQLAALLGMEGTPASRVQAVVDVSGPTDFTTERSPDGLAFLKSFLGDQLAAASPVTHVSKDNAAFLIVHGTRDENVPIAQAEELYQKLVAAGVPADFVKVDDVHTFRTPEARRILAAQTVAFFQRYLIPAP